MKKKFHSLHLDFVGFSTSMACALHCSVLPLILALGIFPALEFLTHGIVEAIFIASAIIIASWALIGGYHKHKSWNPLLIAALGFSLILISRFSEGYLEGIFTTIGGLVVATSHYINWKNLQLRSLICSLK